MTLTTIAVLAATSLCLAFAETRWMGIVAIVVLGYLYPLSLLAAAAVVVLGACAFHYFY
jgi:hypothetical protein